MRIQKKTRKTPHNLRGFFVFALALCAGCALPPPESAIDCAVDAARANDRGDFAACFTPRSRAFLGAYWDSVGATRPDLLTLSAGDVAIQAIRPIGDPDAAVARVLAVLTEGGREQRLVLHRLGGRWRIDLWDTRQVSFGIKAL